MRRFSGASAGDTGAITRVYGVDRRSPQARETVSERPHAVLVFRDEAFLHGRTAQQAVGDLEALVDAPPHALAPLLEVEQPPGSTAVRAPVRPVVFARLPHR